MVKLYSVICPPKTSKYIITLIIVFIMNDIYTVCTFYTFYISLNSDEFPTYLANQTINKYTETIKFEPINTCSFFMDFWGVIAPFIPIYYCCFCLILKITLHGFKYKLQKVSNIDFDTLDQTCVEIINLTSDINESFHDILLLVFIMLFLNIFNNVYTILIQSSSTGIALVYRIWNTLIHFTRFVIICLFASSTSKAGFELKRSIYNHVSETSERWKCFLLVKKISESFVEFKFLDSLVLDKNFILASIGSIVTYGIIIATFNINSKI